MIIFIHPKNPQITREFETHPGCKVYDPNSGCELFTQEELDAKASKPEEKPKESKGLNLGSFSNPAPQTPDVLAENEGKKTLAELQAEAEEKGKPPEISSEGTGTQAETTEVKAEESESAA